MNDEQFFRPAEPETRIHEFYLAILERAWTELSPTHPQSRSIPFITVNEESVKQFGTIGTSKRMIEIVDETNEVIIYIANILETAHENGVSPYAALTEMMSLGLRAIKMHLSDHAEL